MCRMSMQHSKGLEWFCLLVLRTPMQGQGPVPEAFCSHGCYPTDTSGRLRRRKSHSPGMRRQPRIAAANDPVMCRMHFRPQYSSSTHQITKRRLLLCRSGSLSPQCVDGFGGIRELRAPCPSSRNALSFQLLARTCSQPSPQKPDSDL